MTCKESFDLAGLPTTFGSPLLKYNVASKDAVTVLRLKAAGAMIFGNTNVPLWLLDFQSYSVLSDTTNNPWTCGVFRAARPAARRGPWQVA